MGRYIVITDDEFDACMLRYMDPTYGRWVEFPEDSGEYTWLKWTPIHDMKLAEEGYNNMLIAGVAHVAERSIRVSETD